MNILSVIKNYLENSARDMHLLYVAMTRALHSLAIFSDGELTYAINNEKVKIKNWDYINNFLLNFYFISVIFMIEESV